MRDSKYFQTLINPLFAYHSKICHSSHHHDERLRRSVCFWQHVNDVWHARYILRSARYSTGENVQTLGRDMVKWIWHQLQNHRHKK